MQDVCLSFFQSLFHLILTFWKWVHFFLNLDTLIHLLLQVTTNAFWHLWIGLILKNFMAFSTSSLKKKKKGSWGGLMYILLFCCLWNSPTKDDTYILLYLFFLEVFSFKPQLGRTWFLVKEFYSFSSVMGFVECFLK